MNFVQERVKELQEDLDSLFQSLSSNSVKENVFRLLRRSTVFQIDLASSQTSSISDVSLDNDIGTERAEVLRKAIDSVQLDKGDIPKMDVILNQLNMVEQGLHGNWKTATNDASFREDEELERGIIHLEWLFLAKMTISIYGKILENLLISTLPLSDDIHYWGELEGNKFWSLIHLFQTSPLRIYSLLGAIFSTIRQQFRDVSSLYVRQPFSLGYMINLFPRYMHTRFLNAPLVSLIRYEIHYKKSMLTSLMEYQAACLGLLICEDKGFDFKKIAEEINGMTKEDRLNVNFCDIIAKKLINCIVLMERILNQATGFDVEKGEMPNINKIFDNVKFSDSPPSLLAFYTHLRSVIITHLPRYDEQFNRIISIYGTPSTLTRWWIPITISTVVAYKTRNHIYEEDFIKWFEEAKSTVVNFWSDWVWEPLIRMMDTIRHKERRLVLMGKDSLNSDLESLERMVLDFVRDQRQLNDEEIVNLTYRIRDGDLSMVLRVYEQELKSPFKSTVTGNLIRTLLIQVQKTKVDMELAMAALDKLLKSNELNFAFLALGPSLFVVYLFSTWIKNIWWNKGTWPGKVKGANVKMRESLRIVERLLVERLLEERDHLLASHPTPFATHGLVICHVHRLRTYAMYLPSKNNLRGRVLDDLRALDYPRMGVRQKVMTCERMWRCWGFLNSRDDCYIHFSEYTRNTIDTPTFDN
ncbi:unnamed protein product [Rhizophagus irregularis]|uniref:NCA2-domain-containing protein n=1 Tax=Rhizophagus irregularis TaxID=588596 RepID=A0A916EAM6_9GLOM|nr:unnamed protein product [Rhizophagus irregularis]